MNLVTGLDSESDRTLHLSVRFAINTVVRNVYQRSSWGTEERGGPFPFAVGRTFTMVIKVERSAYKVKNDFYTLIQKYLKVFLLW